MDSPTQKLQAPTSDEKSQEQYLSVLSDPVNFNIKHPLFHEWSLWYDNPGKKSSQATWDQNLNHLVDFDTVEDFWGVYNNVAKATELATNSNYHLFKKGIKPMWEDKANQRGGKWVVQLMRSRRPEEVNELWLYTMLGCIGESFEYEDEVCGAVMSVRKGFYRIAIWTRSSNRRDVCESIGRQFKSILGLTVPFDFQTHQDASRGGSHHKDKYTV